MDQVTYRSAAHLLAVVLLLVTTGASCPRQARRGEFFTPTVFTGSPTVDEIVNAVNANTQRVMQLETSSAELAIEGVPRLKASLALERPLRFRLRGDTSITGNELDMGSNDELFWLWAKRNEPRAVFYARHREFRPGAGMLPLPPTWLIEALGLVSLDPNTAYDGPHPSGPGRLELTYLEAGTPPLMKTIIVDDQRGHVLEQRVFDQRGELLAAAQMSDYRYDAQHAASLPHVVSVRLPPAQMGFTFKVDSYVVNQPASNPTGRWAMPQVDAPYHNLATGL